MRAYNQMHARAMAYKEIIDLVDTADRRIAEIKARMDSTIKNYGI